MSDEVKDIYPEVVDKDDFNQWFSYFQRQPAVNLITGEEEIYKTLPAVGYAAFKRWIDIFDNPDKMEKIVKTKVDEDKENELIGLAVGDNDEKYYEGIIKQIAIQMNGASTSPQEFARLSANMNIARKELREIRSRKPRQGSTLGNIVDRIAEINSAQKLNRVKASTKATKKKTAPKAVKAPKTKKMSPNVAKTNAKTKGMKENG